MKKVLICIVLIAFVCVILSAGCISSVESTTPSGQPVVENTAAAGPGSHEASAGNAQSFNDLFGNSNIAKPKTATYELTAEEYANLTDEEKAKILVQ